MRKIFSTVVAAALIVVGGIALFCVFSRHTAPAKTSACGGNVASADGLRKIAERISSIDDVAERRRLARDVLTSMRELDVSRLPLDERRRMIASNFFFEGVFPFASALNNYGFSEEEASSWMMAGWKCYRDLCASFDDVDASCSAAEARTRRELARKSRQFYANDYRLMDSRLIGLLFADMPDGAEERFRAKWKAAFAEPDASGR